MENIKEETTQATKEATTDIGRFMTYIEEHIPDMISFGIKVLFALVVFFLGRLLIKGIRKIVMRSMIQTDRDKGVIQFVDSLLKYSLSIVLIFAIISRFGIDTASVAALLASGGVAIGLALQGSLSNFASGFMLMILKPFVVGDYIIEDNNKNEGTVIEIQIFYTKLKTIDGKVIILPNSMLTGNSIINVTASATRQLDLKLQISYDSDLKQVKEILQTILKEQEGILHDMEHSVFVDDLRDMAVIVGIRAYVKTENYFSVRGSLLEEIKQTMDKNHIMLQVTKLIQYCEKKDR